MASTMILLRRCGVGLAAVIVLCSIAGCVWSGEDKKRYDLGVDATAHPLAKSAAFRDTIGSLGYFDGLGPMRVRGYGLVVGLGKNGSSDCPRRVYGRLVQSIYKQHQFRSNVVGTKGISPEQLIADLDTAVVVVQGEVPPVAVRGERFDVVVTALPGTQTKSLRGGRLFTADLQVYRPFPSGVAIMGQVLAQAAGPVFLNPFSGGDAATESNPLEGVVVGGGGVMKDRRLRFVLNTPSYRLARKTQDRINARFTSPRKIADAVSPSFVQIELPAEYHGAAGHFLDLVKALFLSRDPQFEAMRARKLAEEMLRPGAPHARIALCLEGLGRSALGVLDELYAHRDDDVSFHASVAGLRLGDHVACDRLVLHAEEDHGSHRFQAIRALAEAKGMATAAIALRGLLNDTDPRVQVAAYEALLKRNDRTIASKGIAQDNFLLDLVPTSSNKFVYVKRTGSRRIALFGTDLRCQPPLLYRSPDGSITMNAATGAKTLTILRTVVASGTTSSPMSAPFALPRLIELLGKQAAVDVDGTPLGLGLDYGAIVRALYQLAHAESINARFILEQPNASELFGPTRPAGRPESEL